MAHRLALLLAAGASVTAQAQGSPTCLARDGSCGAAAPVLLQTHSAVEKAVEAEAGIVVPPLPPAYAAPDEALAMAQAEVAAGLRGHTDVALLGTSLPSTHSSNEWQVFVQMKALRQQGFRCPKGQYFPPNNGEFLFDCRLWRAAWLGSQDMGQRNFFDHINPDGKDPFDRSNAQGFGTFNENIAAGVADVAGTMDQWKNSDGHCTNMMKASHTRMGAGYAYAESSTYKYYWTQLFGQGHGGADTSCYASGGGAPSPSPSPSPSWGGGGCADTNANCASWTSAGYCSPSSQYYGFMKNSCQASCGICGGAGPAPAPAPSYGCADTGSYCASWASSGYCSSSSQYAGYMQQNCKQSCGFCR